MDWINALKPFLRNCDFTRTTPTLILIELFKDVIYPNMSSNNRGKLVLPDRFSIKVGWNKNVLHILLGVEFFNSAPIGFRKNVLDVLYLILRRDVYDVIRFQCSDSSSVNSDHNGSLLHFLLTLLEDVVPSTRADHDLVVQLNKPSVPRSTAISIAKRIIHLIGIVSSAGISTTSLKRYLSLLKSPTELSVALLQALKIMIRQDSGVNKASPTAFFSFGGSGAGLSTDASVFPFGREYQFCTWFRVENFEEEQQHHHHPQPHHDATRRASNNSSSTHSDHKPFNLADKFTQHLFSWHNSSGHQRGIDMYLEKRVLTIAISNQSTKEPLVLRLNDYPLRRGIWYHICVRHAKPRMALFASDELTVHLDHQLAFQESIRFPVLGSGATDTEFSFGRNLDGQMTPIYLFSEALPPLALETIARLDAGKTVDGVENGFNAVVADLLPFITTSDRKVVPVMSKVVVAFHPSRCQGAQAMDIHGGRHAKMGQRTHSWSIVSARDLLNSMGGLSCLLPLFPKLLIENTHGDEDDSAASSRASPSAGMDVRRGATQCDVTGAGLGTSLAIYSDEGSASSGEGSSALDYSLLSEIQSEKDELNGDGCIALLLSIFAKCITAHKTFQQELVSSGGVEMMEYALTCVPQEILQAEGERCVLALIQLKSAATELPSLELRITKSLLCNIGIWSRASFPLLSSLMSVILAAIRAQPEMFLDLLGVKSILDSLEYFLPCQLQLQGEEGEGGDLTHRHLTDTGSRRPSMDDQSMGGTPLSASDLSVGSTPRGVLKTGTSSSIYTFPESVETPTSSNSQQPTPSSMKIRRPKGGGISFADSSSETNSPAALSSSSTSLSPRADRASSVTDSSSSASARNQRRMSRMKSFKLSLTETIEDSVNEESSQLERIRETDEEHAAHSASTQGEFDHEDRADQAVQGGEAGESVTPFQHSLFSVDELPEDPDVGFNVSASSGVLMEAQGSSPTEQEEEEAPQVESAMNTPASALSRRQSIKSLLDIMPSAETGNESPVPAGTSALPPQSNEQRKHLRDCLESMMVILLQQGGNEKEVAPLLEFMITCKDEAVLNEIAQILLYLLVEGGPKTVSAIIFACNGPEEFASFVLLFLVHQPHEELRCTGIRLLTHFYLRVDVLPPSVVNMTLKRKKGFLARAMSTISHLGSGQGLQRLQLCGGLALLCEVVSAHTKSSSELTYSALLELLLTKPGSKCQVTVQYSDLFDTGGTLTGGQSGASGGTATNNTNNTQSLKRVRSNTFGHGKVSQRAVVFAAHYLSPDQVHDEGTGADMTNGLVLPIFFELLPKLPVQVQEQVYGDLLALLKHSAGNRDAFCNSPSWHLCMFGLVSQLVMVGEKDHGGYGGRIINSYAVIGEIEKFTASGVRPATLHTFRKSSVKKHHRQGALLRSWRSGSNSDILSSYMTSNGDAKTGSARSSRQPSPATGNGAAVGNRERSSSSVSVAMVKGSDEDRDLWFALGMKIYATLLLHAMEYKSGWREVDRCISQSDEGELAYSVSQTVLSHLLNELTFSMKSKYRELQRLAKSTQLAENHRAKDKLENILCLLLSSSQLSLMDQHCATSGIQNFHICKLRVHYLNELCRSLIAKKMGSTEELAEEDEEVAPPVTQLELRRLLEQTEDMLRQKLRLASPETVVEFDETNADGLLSIDTDALDEAGRSSKAAKLPEASNGDRDEYEQHLDFFHVWSDLSLGAEDDDHSALFTPHKEHGGLPPASNKSAAWRAAQNGTSSSGFGLLLSASSPASSSPMKSIEELLHPLERNHDTAYGKLILVLQALRFFDVLFWPNDSVPLRNTELLRFNKEGVIGIDVSTGPPGSNPSSTAKRSKNEPANSPSHMTIFSASMRMCLFVLGRLSPLTHLSVVNSKRIRVLVAAVDKVTQYNTPTHDWLLAAVLHTTLNLQRIALVLEPVYAMLGVTERVLIGTLGPWPDSYDDTTKLDDKETRLFELAGNDVELMQRLQQYFDSSPGRNLVRNIRHSLHVLVDTFELHNSKLAQTLEERTFRALWVLVEQIKNDVQTVQKLPDTSIPKPPPVLGTPTRSLFKSQFRGRFESNHNMSVSMDANGDIFEPPVASPSANPSASPLPGFGRKRSSSDGSSASEQSNASSDQGDSNRAFKPSATTSPSPIPAEQAASIEEESFFGADIVLILKWLRFPYLRLNPYRSIGLVKAIDALDYLEAKSVGKFSGELQHYRAGLEEQRDFALKSVEEMTELKELSLCVFDLMRDRNDARETALKNTESLKLKNVAARWHDCIQVFEGEWSPWRSDSHDTSLSGSRGVAHYELSKHRDNRLRKMVLTKLPEPVSHLDAAYMEGKARDQLHFEQAGSASSSSGAGPSDKSISRVSLPFRVAASSAAKGGAKSDKSVNNNWDGDDDEDAAATPASSSVPVAAELDFGKGIAMFFQGGEKRPQWTQSFQWAPDERSLFITDAAQINLDQVVGGVVLLTNRCLYFHSRKRLGGLAVSSKPIVDQRWHLDRLIEAYGRRYLLQNCAIELFFTDAPELFLAFKALSELQRFFRALRRQSTPLLTTPRSLNPRYAFANSPWTEMWRKRQISNFEYLMRLNVISGRSYNDITQYPVFPWILADYTSDTLDLTDPSVFRPLNMPIGALNPTRLQEFLERYKSYDDDVVPKFMYGSHYSSAGVVIHYMIRQEPFSTLAINLQGGRFDCPDRIFFDINRSWQGVNQSMSDVKELIPEMFCCPEALLNSNALPLGELQEGGVVNDVILPPWAHNSAYEFVRINREALESDYVSEHLHEWIDLIFGCKQVGPAALAANNVFYYLTYENAVNIEAIEDPLQREAAKAQVTHFGQTPSQLTNREHPRRYPKEDCTLPLFSDLTTIRNITVYTPPRQSGASFGSVVSMRCLGGDRLVVVHANLTLCYYRWAAFPDGEGNPFTVRPERSKVLPSAVLSASDEILRGRDETSRPSFVDVTPTKGVAFAAETKSASNRSPQNTSSNGDGLLGVFRKSFKGMGIFDYSQPSVANAPVTLTRKNSVSVDWERSSTGSLGEPPAVPSTTLVHPPPSSCSIAAMSGAHVALSASELGHSRVVSCGYWDNSLKIHGVESLKEVASTSNGHLGAITCVQLGYQGGHTVISGGADGTCRVWILEKPSLAAAFTPESYYGEYSMTETEAQQQASEASISAPASPLTCVHILSGHQHPVRAISYSTDLDAVLSGSLTGLLCLHSVRKGSYIRSITHMLGTSADLVLASAPGYLVAHSWSDLRMHLYWINGQHLASIQLTDRVECVATSSAGNVLVCGSAAGVLTFREIWSLKELFSISMEAHGSIKSLWFSEDFQFLFIGSEDGLFSVATDVDARWKLLNSSLQKSPMG